MRTLEDFHQEVLIPKITRQREIYVSQDEYDEYWNLLPDQQKVRLFNKNLYFANLFSSSNNDFTGIAYKDKIVCVKDEVIRTTGISSDTDTTK